MFNALGLANVKVNLQEIILGYKVNYSYYNWVNFVLVVYAFTVYKGHLIIENRTKKINYWNLFKYEINRRVNSMRLREKPAYMDKFIKLMANL